MSFPQANKKLGQHFLVNTGVIDRIADTVTQLAQIPGGLLPVLEIGPGPGPLTAALLVRKLKVTALELDERMVEALEQRFPQEIASGQLRLLSGDALKFDLEALETELLREGASQAVACGNLPYNVGTSIVFRLLEEFGVARSFCYMLQKEVVLRMISAGNDADYGIPGVKLAWSTRMLGHFWVKPGSFSPPPRVDSGVLWFERRTGEKLLASPLERKGPYDIASRFLDRAFGQRRKMLRAIFPELKESPVATRRAQELSPEELFSLGIELTKPPSSNET